MVDSCAGYTLFTVCDIKACFHNIPVHPLTQPFLGITTQDGLWVCERLPFGLQQGPAVVQAEMDDTLSELTEASVFVDDVTVKGYIEHW